ncbi:hypothetical protein BLA29_007566, partial [Euroglyphus maynei]
MPSKKKRFNARFPPARIKKIMQKDEEVGKVAQAVPVIIAKALESFAEQLLTISSEVTRTRNALYQATPIPAKTTLAMVLPQPPTIQNHPNHNNNNHNKTRGRGRPRKRPLDEQQLCSTPAASTSSQQDDNDQQQALKNKQPTLMKTR